MKISVKHATIVSRVILPVKEREGGIYRKYEAVRVEIVQQEFSIKKGEKVKYRESSADLMKVCR